MTVLLEVESEQYPGNGVADEFDFRFLIFAASEMVARLIDDTTGYAEELVDSVDYTLEVSETGGTVTTTDPVPSGFTLDLRPEYSMTQPTSIKNQGTFRPEVHERIADRLASQIAMLHRLLRRTIHLADFGEVDADLVLPLTRAGLFLAFDAERKPVGASGTGNDAALRVDLASGTNGSEGSRLVAHKRSEAGAVTRSTFSILSERASARDFLSNPPDGSTDNTAGLQAWLNCGAKKLFLPSYSNSYRATGLTQRIRSTIEGDATRGSVIRQLGTAGVLLTAEAGLPPSGGTNDITEGGYGYNDLTLQPSAAVGCHGLAMETGTLANMLRSRGLRIQSQQSESHGSAPYPVIDGQYGIKFNGAGGGGVLYNLFDTLEIRGFGAAVHSRGIVNEIKMDGWFLDNKADFDVQGISTWETHVTHESSVANACSWRMDGTISNVHIWDPRHELNELDSYILELLGAASPQFANVHIWLPNVLVASDGSAWPGRKYLNLADVSTPAARGGLNGILPPGIFFHVMVGSHPNFTWLNIGSSASVQEFSPTMRVGGDKKGNGKLIFGRNLDNGAEASVEHDGTNLKLSAANFIEFAGASGATGYQHAVKFGSIYEWYDSTNKKRFKAGIPANDTDGTVIGTQT